MTKSRAIIALALPSLITWLVGAFLILDSGFNGLYGQDAYAYYDYAIGPLRASLLAGESPPPFYWPPGFPLLVALISFVVGVTPRAGQVVSLAAGGLVPLFTALLAARLWPAGVRGRLPGAALAGLLAACVGQLWQSSVVVMSDTTGLAAATLGTWAVAVYGQKRRAGWLALAAGALAFAILVRWALALVAVIATLYALAVLARRPRRAAAGQALLAGLVALVVLSPVLGPAGQLLAGDKPAGPSFTVDLEVVTWSPVNALRRSFVTSDGLLQYRLPNGLYYALAPARSFYFSPLLALFLLPGLWAVLRRRAGASLFLVAGGAALVYCFLAGIPWQNFRFTLTYLPPLAILAAVGVLATVGALSRWNVGARCIVPLRRYGRAVLALWLAAGLAWMAIGGYRLASSFIATMQANVATVRWLEAQVPPNARVIAFGLALTLAHESELETINIYYPTPAELEALLEDDRPLYLLLEVENVESQWAGRSPTENYHWLRDNPGLTEIGRNGAYTLFRIGSYYSKNSHELHELDELIFVHGGMARACCLRSERQ